MLRVDQFLEYRRGIVGSADLHEERRGFLEDGGVIGLGGNRGLVGCCRFGSFSQHDAAASPDDGRGVGWKLFASSLVSGFGFLLFAEAYERADPPQPAERIRGLQVGDVFERPRSFVAASGSGEDIGHPEQLCRVFRVGRHNLSRLLDGSVEVAPADGKAHIQTGNFVVERGVADGFQLVEQSFRAVEPFS